MKNLMYHLMPLLVMVFTVQAQDKDRDQIKLQDKDQVRLHDCLLLEEGTVYLLSDQDRDRDQLEDRDGDLDQDRDQDKIQLKDQIRLHDGTLVSSDGTFIDANGVQQKLREGERIDMDGNRYATREQFRQMIQIRSKAMVQPHYVFQDGQVFMVQNQQRTQIRQRIQLGEASIDPKGNLEFANRARTQLRNGECLDPEGNLYGTQAQFRQHAQLRLQAMEQEHFVFRNGAMYQVRNQEQTRVESPLALPNDIIVYADGSVRLRDRDRIRLRDGECMDPEGNVFGSQLQFRNHEQTRLMAMNQEHFVYQDGALYQVQNQERQRVREQLMLRDGTSIHEDGTIRKRDQEQSRLRNGECIDTDGNRYGTQQQFREQMQHQYMAMSEPHFFYQNGKMYQMKNQIKVQMQERWSLNNGTVVNPDGTYQLKNQRRERLQNGEYLDWDGKRYENQERFRERMQERVQDRMEIRERERIERKGATESRRRIGS